MMSKLNAAAKATRAGASAHIGHSEADYLQLMTGKVGTKVVQRVIQ
jgi:glutamate 5-kinase